MLVNHIKLVRLVFLAILTGGCDGTLCWATFRTFRATCGVFRFAGSWSCMGTMQIAHSWVFPPRALQFKYPSRLCSSRGYTPFGRPKSTNHTDFVTRVAGEAIWTFLHCIVLDFRCDEKNDEYFALLLKCKIHAHMRRTPKSSRQKVRRGEWVYFGIASEVTSIIFLSCCAGEAGFWQNATKLEQEIQERASLSKQKWLKVLRIQWHCKKGGKRERLRHAFTVW